MAHHVTRDEQLSLIDHSLEWNELFNDSRRGEDLLDAPFADLALATKAKGPRLDGHFNAWLMSSRINFEQYKAFFLFHQHSNVFC